MDHSEEFYTRIPFYMTYPAQNIIMAEMEYENDMELMKNYYPRECAQILELVEKRLDELSYEGSRIYDEEPDRYMIQREIDGICRRSKEPSEKSYFEMVPMSLTEGKDKPPCPGCAAAGVIFCSELYKRRCQKRRRGRFW